MTVHVKSSAAGPIKGENLQHVGEVAMEEAWGASQIGPFDFVPPLGFRGYWYPALWKKEVGAKAPKHVELLGENIVFFRGKDGTASALIDWCPHRNARLSLGISEFPGTITCPYHGYTFDGTGQCVAGLIDHPESPVVPKMRAKSYPTAEYQDVVYIWMGETDPVPLEDDLPAELLDERNYRYIRTKEWETNWTEPIAQGIDFHEGYLHRMGLKFLPMFPGEPIWARTLMNLTRVFNTNLRFFRPKVAFYGGTEIVHEEENLFAMKAKGLEMGQAYHPGVDSKWPAHTWWRFLKSKTRSKLGSLLTGNSFDHSCELPSKIRSVVRPESVHLRWMVPVTAGKTRVWTFTICRRPRTILGQLWQNIWYYFWRKGEIVVATNEQEDLATFKEDRLRFDLPQKLGPLDAGLIYFRRHLSRCSRDYKRLGGSRGALKAEPTRTAEEWRTQPEDLDRQNPIEDPSTPEVAAPVKA